MKMTLESVRSKIVFALGGCVIVITVIGVYGGMTIDRLSHMVQDEYEGTVKPIRDLGTISHAETDLRLRLRHLSAGSASHFAQEAPDKMRADFAAVAKAWADYYPARVSTTAERGVADQINEAMPRLHDKKNQSSGCLAMAELNRATL